MFVPISLYVLAGSMKRGSRHGQDLAAYGRLNKSYGHRYTSQFYVMHNSRTNKSLQARTMSSLQLYAYACGAWLA